MFRENGGKINAHATLIAKIDARVHGTASESETNSFQKMGEKRVFLGDACCTRMYVLVCTYTGSCRVAIIDSLVD